MGASGTMSVCVSLSGTSIIIFTNVLSSCKLIYDVGGVIFVLVILTRLYGYDAIIRL